MLNALDNAEIEFVCKKCGCVTKKSVGWTGLFTFPDFPRIASIWKTE